MPESMRKTTKAASETKDTKEKEAESVSKEDSLEKENKELKDTLSELMKKVEMLTSTKQEPVIVGSKMDRPCTLIHLVECIPQLPTTIRIGTTIYSFSKFGEKRTFRFSDMQDITSRYRDWFERGIFTLGEDCDDFSDDFGVEIMSIPMSPSNYKKIAEFPIDKFKEIVNSLTMNQAVLLSKAWIQRYENKEYGYDNMEKIKILDTKTKGFLKPFISDMLTGAVGE